MKEKKMTEQQSHREYINACWGEIENVSSKGKNHKRSRIKKKQKEYKKALKPFEIIDSIINIALKTFCILVVFAVIFVVFISFAMKF